MRLFEHSKNEIINMFIDCIKQNELPTSEFLNILIINNGSGTLLGLTYFESFVKEILDDIIETVNVNIMYLPKHTDTELNNTPDHDYRIEYYPIVLSYPKKTQGVWQMNKKIQYFTKFEKISLFSNLSYKVFNNSYSCILFLKITFKRSKF